MKITVCIGSSCHIKGSRIVVEELQALITLRYDMEMGYAQIAQAMNISPVRVKWRLNEALKKLRAALGSKNAAPKTSDQNTLKGGGMP